MISNTFDDWIGRQETVTDMIAPSPLAGLSATLDHVPGESPWTELQVPPLGHWLYFLPRARQSEIGGDGHPERGGFLPPIQLPRRMWAGSQIRFDAPLPVGVQASRTSTIRAIEAKSGKLGDLVFVTVEHEIAVAGAVGPAIVERQDIVYRQGAAPGSASSPAASATEPVNRICEWSRELKADPAMLFRYSALTFNAHRIHYDRDYCRDVEGYAGLVVHGPFSATLLVDLFLRQHSRAQVRSFAFRAKRPIIDSKPIRLCGKRTASGAELWILDADGHEAITAELEVR